MKWFCFLGRDLEEDPLFGDDLSPNSRLSGSGWLGSSPPQSPDHSKSDGKMEVHKIVNRCELFSVIDVMKASSSSDPVCVAFSFLCLVPDEAKSSYQVEGSGYDTYLRDAHRQVRRRRRFGAAESQVVRFTCPVFSSGTSVASASGGTGGDTPNL